MVLKECHVLDIPAMKLLVYLTGRYCEKTTQEMMVGQFKMILVLEI